MKTQKIHIAEGESGQIAFEVIGKWTRSPKKSVACINYSLMVSQTTGIAGSAYFESLEDAKLTFDHNAKKANISMHPVQVKVGNSWQVS